MRTLFRTVLVALFSVATFAQTGVQNQTDVAETEHVPIYRITVVARTIKAINYATAAVPHWWGSEAPA